MRAWLSTIALVVTLLSVAPTPATSALPASAPAPAPAAPAPQPKTATPAPAALVAELRPIIESARQRFEARDAAGVLANVSERYRSGGLTKASLREQLLSLFSLYDAMRVR